MVSKEVKILIADDHPVFRQGLRSVIESENGFRVVGEAENGIKALEMLQSLQPDMVILDVDMPEMNGIEAAKAIAEKAHETKIAFLTIHKNSEILDAMQDLNVHGYMLKDSALAEILSCIEQVMSGKRFISSAIFEIAFAKKKKATLSLESDTESLLSDLTPAESRILGCIANGMMSRDIAEHLFISIRTVENHRSNIGSKLDLRGNNSLLKFALENKDLILKSK